MKKEAIISMVASGTISVIFGIIGIFEGRKHAKQQREALCAQLHADMISEEAQIMRDTLEDVKEYKEKHNIQNEGGKES